MDFLQAFEQFVQSVGFPIAACCVMFYQNSKMQKILSDLSIALNTLNNRIEEIEDSLK